MSDPSDQRQAVERALMDRFRDRAHQVPEKPPRPLLQQVIALLVSVALVILMLLGFDAFLTTVQKFMEIGAEQPVPAATVPAPTDPIPAFVVPAEVSPPPPVDPDPRPSPPQAPDNAPATPR
jgi:hypothetical protein